MKHNGLSEGERERLVSMLVEAGIHRAGEGQARQLLRTARRRGELIEQLKFLNAGEVAKVLGLRGEDYAAEVEKLHSRGELLAVRIGNEDLYPEFQFDARTRKVQPIIADLVGNFDVRGDSVRSWNVVYWLASPCGLLEDCTPLSLIHGDPEQVLETAERELAGEDF